METVRDRLERLKDPYKKPEPQITPETIFMRKVEKAIQKIESIRKKMLSDSAQYLSLFYELRKAEDEFLMLLDDKEMKFLDLPDSFMKLIDSTKAKIRRKS